MPKPSPTVVTARYIGQRVCTLLAANVADILSNEQGTVCSTFEAIEKAHRLDAGVDTLAFEAVLREPWMSVRIHAGKWSCGVRTSNNWFVLGVLVFAV